MIFSIKKTSVLFISFFISVLILQGCMPKRPQTDPLMDKKALTLLLKIRGVNPVISAVRGKGWLELKTDKIKERFRIVWAACYPDKGRITLLLYGSPVESIIVNGERISFISHTGRHGVHTRKSKNMSLKAYTGIPVKISDLLLCLLGTLPVKAGSDVYFLPEDPSLSTIVVHDETRPGIQHISLTPEKKTKQIQFLDNAAQLIYEIVIKKYKNFTFGDIPVQLELRDEKGRELLIDITDFEPHDHIKDKVFELTESES